MESNFRTGVTQRFDGVKPNNAELTKIKTAKDRAEFLTLPQNMNPVDLFKMLVSGSKLIQVKSLVGIDKN